MFHYRIFRSPVLYCMVAALAITACSRGETRVARWPLAVHARSGKQGDRLGVLAKGERVELIAQEGDYAQIRMVDGQEGYVEARHLFLDAIVVSRDAVDLYRRPSASSGRAPGNSNLDRADVLLVSDRQENEEGEWLEVQGGTTNADWIAGWIKADSGYEGGAGLVQDALLLEEAVRKGDREALDELAGESSFIGSAAAAALQSLEPEPVEEQPAPDDAAGDETN